MKVVAIGGSPRLKGNTNFLIDQALGELALQGLETEKIVLNEYKIAPCQGHDDCASFTQCRMKDDAPWILDKFSQADGLILASPVYCFSYSAQMKTFQDRTYFSFTHERRLRARCAGLIAIGGGDGVDETIQALKSLIEYSQIKTFTLTGYAGGEGDAKNQPELINQAKNMGRQMAEVLLAERSH
jgi:multimeric flavodoxin WrbA